MKLYEIIFSHSRFELLKGEEKRFFLRLKGRAAEASPGLRRITEKEACELIELHRPRVRKRSMRKHDYAAHFRCGHGDGLALTAWNKRGRVRPLDFARKFYGYMPARQGREHFPYLSGERRAYE